MIVFSHLFIVLFLTIVMTVFTVNLPLCNLLVIYVVLLALTSPGLSTGVFGSLLAGIILDGVSAATFGIFSLSFFWLFCVVRILRRFVHPNSLVFALLSVLAGIVLINFFVLTTFFFGKAGGEALPFAGKVLFCEMLSGLVLTPLLFFLLRMLQFWLFYPRNTKMVALTLRSSSELK